MLVLCVLLVSNAVPRGGLRSRFDRALVRGSSVTTQSYFALRAPSCANRRAHRIKHGASRCGFRGLKLLEYSAVPDGGRRSRRYAITSIASITTGDTITTEHAATTCLLANNVPRCGGVTADRCFAPRAFMGDTEAAPTPIKKAQYSPAPSIDDVIAQSRQAIIRIN